MKPTNRESRSTGRSRAILALALIIAASSLLTGCGASRAPASLSTEPSLEPTSAPVPATAAQVADRYGVEVTLVALTAANGLVNCRFRVRDPVKAAFLLQADGMPLLIAEQTDLVIQIHQPIDQPALIEDRVYSVIYPNVQNALQPGDEVSLVIADLRLEHMVVQ